MAFKEVSPKEAADLQQQGWVLIDVRTPAEFTKLHAEGAHNLPLDQLGVSRFKEFAPTGKALLICASGGRSRKAGDLLTEFDLRSIIGGTGAWVQAGLPVVRGQGVMSIERQVRIGAGALVVLGVLLGYLVSPFFNLLSLFVGCGLIFAGVTDLCGMALVLAKMPWNRACDQSTERCCAE